MPCSLHKAVKPFYKYFPPWSDLSDMILSLGFSAELLNSSTAFRSVQI